ncbi:MAG: hypothetical protein ACRCZF_11010 [Gemmataceae bacterium]
MPPAPDSDDADSMSIEDQIDEMTSLSWFLSNGPGKIQLYEEAVRLADSANNAELAYETRMELIEAATFGGRPDIAIVHYVWCLATFDKNPSQFDRHDLYWKYKWILGNATSYPQISQTKLNEMLADFQTRMKKSGYGMHAYWQTARKIARTLHHMPEVLKCHKKVNTLQRGELSNCHACEIDDCAEIDLLTKGIDAALATAEPLFNGEESCTHVPNVTYPFFLVPLVKAGQIQTAIDFYHHADRMTANDHEFLSSWGHILAFLGMTDNLVKGLELFRNGLFASTSAAPLERFRFLHGASLVVMKLQEQKKKSIRLRVPEGVPLVAKGGWMAVDDIAAWLEEELQELATQFDARNGNDTYSAQLTGREELLTLGQPVDLTAPVPQPKERKSRRKRS